LEKSSSRVNEEMGVEYPSARIPYLTTIWGFITMQIMLRKERKEVISWAKEDL
jgi:hypothetical protein